MKINHYRKYLFTAMTMLLLAVVQPSFVNAANLHAILVGDTVTDDIGTSVVNDLTLFQAEMQKVSKQTGLKLKKTVMDGKTLRAETLINQVEKLSVRPNDVIVFYFSGHGYRTNSKENPWPNLYISTEDVGVDFSLIVQELSNKHPRLLVSIADVCNNVIPDLFAPPTTMSLMSAAPKKVDFVKLNYRLLFLQTKGVITIASSKAGEYSWSTDLGGLYTRAFFESLEREVHGSTTANWQSILDRAAYTIHEDQTPIYNVAQN